MTSLSQNADTVRYPMRFNYSIRAQILTRITRMILVLGKSALSVPDTRFSRVSGSTLINILLVFHECILQQYKEQYIIFFPDLVLHVFTFLCSPINLFSQIFDLIKLLCTHDLSRVTFATELSTKLVYKISFCHRL